MDTPPESEVPVYVINDDGLSLPAVPVAARPSPWGSPWLWTALILAITACVLDRSGWMRPVEAAISRRQQHAALGPYRAWALSHPISYEDVVSNPGAWDGQVVIWEIGRALDGSWCLNADAAKKVIWTSSQESQILKIGAAQKVLARVESSDGRVPLLALLEVL